MSTILNLTKNSCRGVVWRSLQSKSHNTVRNAFPLMHKEFSELRQKPAALFSTSTSVCATSNAAHDHNHSKIWTTERFLSAGLLALLPAGLAFPSPALDYALALALTVHVHWGIEAIVVDYVRPNVVGATMSKAALAAVYALSVFTLGGLFYFNYNDVGLCQAIRMLWKL